MTQKMHAQKAARRAEQPHAWLLSRKHVELFSVAACYVSTERIEGCGVGGSARAVEEHVVGEQCLVVEQDAPQCQRKPAAMASMDGSQRGNRGPRRRTAKLGGRTSFRSCAQEGEWWGAGGGST